MMTDGKARKNCLKMPKKEKNRLKINTITEILTYKKKKLEPIFRLEVLMSGNADEKVLKTFNRCPLKEEIVAIKKIYIYKKKKKITLSIILQA